MERTAAIAADSNVGRSQMDIRSKGIRRFLFWGAIGAIFCVAISVVVRQQPPKLNAMETRCVGRWSFISPNDSTRLIVLHFDSRRQVREEYYYLDSATPTIPRTTMLGQWRVESDGQLIVEPSAGVGGMLDAASGKARANLADDERLPKPVLRRSYWIIDATNQGLQVRGKRSGKTGQVEFTMEPFNGVAGIPKLPAQR